MKIRNFALCGIVVCAMLLISTEASPQFGNILDRIGKGGGKQDALRK